MTILTGEADSARQPRAFCSGLLRQIWINRADYLYVLPALVVMLIVIAYPIYYTVEPVLLQNAAWAAAEG